MSMLKSILGFNANSTIFTTPTPSLKKGGESAFFSLNL